MRRRPSQVAVAAFSNPQPPCQHGRPANTLRLPAPFRHASMIQLTGPSLAATDGESISGARVADNGSFPPPAAVAIPGTDQASDSRCDQPPPPSSRW
jgi:hypothetical protein